MTRSSSTPNKKRPSKIAHSDVGSPLQVGAPTGADPLLSFDFAHPLDFPFCVGHQNCPSPEVPLSRTSSIQRPSRTKSILDVYPFASPTKSWLKESTDGLNYSRTCVHEEGYGPCRHRRISNYVCAIGLLPSHVDIFAVLSIGER